MKNRNEVLSITFMLFAFVPPIAQAVASGEVEGIDDRHPYLVVLDEGQPVHSSSTVALHLLSEEAERRGQVPVIIRLKVPGDMPNEPDTHLIRHTQQLLIDQLAISNKNEFKIKWLYDHSPSLAIYVDREALLALAANPNVLQIMEDKPVSIALDGTVPIVGADHVHALGNDGSNAAIAILDTGVDRNHPFLSGRVVHERCYSTTNDLFVTTCANGMEEDSGIGSARPCDYHDSCYHGTHVAGIAAGSAPDQSFSGIAPGADIIAINIFSRPREGGGVQSHTSDMKKALDHIYALRNTYSIGAVNMSLGSGEYNQYCDSFDPAESIDGLRAAGILTVIASGNGSHKNGIAYPACISSAVSVGNTLNNDTVNPSSNSAAILDMLAPGTAVLSSDLDQGLVPDYENRTGTSMAAPHVVGAIALIKSQHPAWTADQIESVLKSNGPLITDSNGISRRRLDVGSILDAVTPVLTHEYLGCSFGASRYIMRWFALHNVADEWDADIQSYAGGLWYAWYNGTADEKSLQFNGGHRTVRVRGRNEQGWGPFVTRTVNDVCDSSGGPDPFMKIETAQE